MEYYCSPSAMTTLPSHPLLSDLPKGPGPLRSVVQGLVLNREWASDYGVDAGAVRVDDYDEARIAVTSSRTRLGRRMGIIKQWRAANRLRKRAKADPAIRDSWISLYYSVMTEPRQDAHMPSTWRSVFEEFEGGPPCRQELEWWRAMYMMNLAPRTRLMYTASAEAIKEMLPDAPDGPSDERYVPEFGLE